MYFTCVFPGLMGSSDQDDFLCDEAVECVNDTAQALYKPIFEKDETRKVRLGHSS